MKNAFSLMEMMVVLLIVAIIAAATAPMVTKKMMRNAGSGDSPWVFTGLGNNIAYNMAGANATAIIGAPNYTHANNEPSAPRLVLANGGNSNTPSLAFANSDGSYAGQIIMDKTNGIVTMNNAQVGKHSVAIGMNQTLSNPENRINTTSIGDGTTSDSSYTVTAGYKATTTSWFDNFSECAIAIGANAHAEGNSAIAIGGHTDTNTDLATSANGSGSIAIGQFAKANGRSTTAIGPGAFIREKDSNNKQITFSCAIGANAIAEKSHQIVLGSPQDTIYIPGHLVAQDIVAAGGLYFFDSVSNDHSLVSIRQSDKARDARGSVRNVAGVLPNTEAPRWIDGYALTGLSDRRLKNVGEKYTAGLEELKKLDFYHYTFKKDEAKTPMVGVMAQDLQKVFPDAVKKGDDGFLRIRLEDMFYAVINAVKELDTKISQIVENVTSISQKVDEQQKLIEAQSQKIEALEKQNAELQDEIKDIEKRIKKLGKKSGDALN